MFVYSAGKLVAEYSTRPSQTPSVSYTTTDHLGSPRIITDQLGQVKARRDFMPFGEELFINIGARSTDLKYGSSADNVRQKFTGYQKDDETGLDFAEARMYENRHGRFTAVDPLLASGNSANPQTFNRYVYVTNNPIFLTDPLGLDPWWRGNCQNGRCSFREAKDKPTDGSWESVTFNGLGYATVDDWNGSGSTAYLYSNGGHDSGIRARLLESSMENVRLAFSFNDPKYLGARDPQVRDAASDVMASGAAILNIPAETYNFAAWGANKLGGNFSYAPTLSPDEHTRPGGNLFFYGSNAGFAVQGGVNVFRGFRNFFSLEGISQIRPNGSVNTLVGGGQLGQDAKTLVVTESHLTDLRKIFSNDYGQRNIFRQDYWKHTLPHRHIYELPSPPTKLNANWRKTFENLGASKRTIFRWEPLTSQ